MTRQEAFDMVLEQAKELGVPYVFHEKDSEDDLKQWGTLTFDVSHSDTDLDRVFEFEMDLLADGISFDTGYGFSGRDWEMDWSFTVK